MKDLFNQQNVVEIFNSKSQLHSAVVTFFARSIAFAHAISPKGWVIYEVNGAIVFSIRNVYTISLRGNLSGHNIDGILIMFAKSLLTPALEQELKKRGCSIDGGFERTGPGGSMQVTIPFNDEEQFAQALALIRPAHEKFISNVLKPGKKTSWRHLYNPAIIQYLREATGDASLPAPAYSLSPSSSAPSVEASMSIISQIEKYIESKQYYFSPRQIASFYTALQTKGLVILSGISGTGKTKLAQLFAEMLPAPTQDKNRQAEDAISIRLQPDHKKRHRFIIPNRYLPLLQPIEANQRMEIVLTYKSQSQMCWMKFYEYPDRSPYLMFWLKEKAIQWVDQDFPEGSTLILQPEFADERLTGLTLLENGEQPQDVETEPGTNSLFISVRPDWRDSKSLLGYYNPLTRTYEWTPFLRFLEKASANYETDKKLAWFVILDEMNLARVEYYFADLLSVLESGRDENGYTREPLRFQFAEEADPSQMPPPEMYLPPNLYFIGTVNVDETTQAFSPKVLDRAFSIEFVDVDFARYIELTSQPNSELDAFNAEHGKALLQAFTRAGEFARIDKNEIAAFIQSHPEPSRQLQELNQALQPYNLHFGYRVFDEIMMFLNNAEDFGDAFDPASAFDQAVLMKVLPKFHGSRGKLEKPLGVVLEWCAQPDRKADIAQAARANPTGDLIGVDWLCPETARRVLRMFQALDSTGFASFG